jgi:hypothetical protein
MTLLGWHVAGHVVWWVVGVTIVMFVVSRSVRYRDE